jgi:hypothetical protein
MSHPVFVERLTRAAGGGTGTPTQWERYARWLWIGERNDPANTCLPLGVYSEKYGALPHPTKTLWFASI